MAKILAAINMTLDGYCDHTLVNADEELHAHYTDVIKSGSVILYGRKTYELMKFWEPLVDSPSGDASMDDFAIAMDNIPKIVFSSTLKGTGWSTANLANRPLNEVVQDLKKQSSKPVLVGSPSLITALTNAGLIDEYQICIHTTVGASGIRLFDNLNRRTDLAIYKTHLMKSGSLILYMKPATKNA